MEKTKAPTRVLHSRYYKKTRLVPWCQLEAPVKVTIDCSAFTVVLCTVYIVVR